MSLRMMHLQDLNPHLLCVLCGGYLVDATTIVECLHSFCRSCIVKYLQTSFHCPVCDVEVHKTKPLLHIRPDRTLQDIVYKIVPGIYQEELNRRKEFETSLKEKSEEQETKEEPQNAEKEKESLPFEDPVCITLEYFRKTRNRMEKEIFPTRYLRCSSTVTVKVLKKFLVMKFAIPETHLTEIIRSDEILDGHLTMKEVCRIYGLYSKPFVDLQYVFLEKNDDDTPVEKPKIFEVKKKRIKKRKGNKTLLKKCLSPDAPRRKKKKGMKKAATSSVQASENVQAVDMEPSQARPLENEKKENLVLSPIDLCANVKKEIISSEEQLRVKVKGERSLSENFNSVDKTNVSGLAPNMGDEIDGNVNENEAPGINRVIVKSVHDVSTEPLFDSAISENGNALITTPAPAVNGLIHGPLSETDSAKRMDTGFSTYDGDVYMNHVSTDLESSALLNGLLVESS